MRNTLETRLGIFFAMALIAVVVIMELIGSLDFFRKGVQVHALFDSVKELRLGDPVRLAGVNVGRVEDIGIVTNKVRVTLKIEDASGVRTDSRATIQFAGLMGQNYVSLSFGSAQGEPVDQNTYLETTEQPDLASIMAKMDRVATGVDNLTRSFTGDDIQNLLGPFTDFLKENSGKLANIIANGERVSDQIAAGEGTVGKLIMDDALHASALEAVDSLTTTSEDLQVTLADAQKIVAEIRQGKGTIGQLMQDETLYNETEVAMTNLREILEKMNWGQGTVGQLINDKAFYNNVKLSLQKLDKAAESLEDQGPVSVLGIAIGTLF